MEYVNLRDICEIKMGQSPESSSYNSDKQGVPFYQGNADFGALYPSPRIWCNKPIKLAKENDILISVRAPVGALNFSKEECCIGRGLAAITLDSNDFLLEFIYWSLRTGVKELQSKSTGSTFKSINKKTLEEVRIPKISLKEQKDIIRNLTLLTNILAKYKHEIVFMDELVKARFVEMFGGVNDSIVYSYKKLNEITDIISGGTPKRDKPEYWENGIIPWVKTTELKNNKITYVEEYITQKGLSESSAKLVPQGTVLVAMYGQGKTRGMTAYLNVEASTNQACACILPSEEVNSIFLWKYLEFSYVKLRSLAKGAGQPNLNVNMIKEFSILVPPLNLQEEYASFVQEIDKSRLLELLAIEHIELLLND